MMSEPANDQERMLQDLSALTDGECEPGQLLAACDVWRRDHGLRASWHTYALIGDVMRSDDLASPVARDAAFLRNLRARLAEEPVILAPAQTAVPAALPMPAVQRLASGGGSSSRFTVRSAGPGRRWVTPAAIAAGFVVVTGAMVVMRSAAPDAASSGATLVQNSPGRDQPRTEQSTLDPSVAFVTNPQLDRYLNAHRQYSQSSGLAVPGGVRQVADMPGGR